MQPTIELWYQLPRQRQFRNLAAATNTFGFRLFHVDVAQALVLAIIDHEMKIKLPCEYRNMFEKAVRHNRSLYGLNHNGQSVGRTTGRECVE